MPTESRLPDRRTALLDLVAGWLEFVDAAVEAGDDPAAYPAPYRDELRALLADATHVADEDGPDPAAFLRERLLPLFAEPPS